MKDQELFWSVTSICKSRDRICYVKVGDLILFVGLREFFYPGNSVGDVSSVPQRCFSILGLVLSTFVKYINVVVLSWKYSLCDVEIAVMVFFYSTRSLIDFCKVHSSLKFHDNIILP